MYMKNAFTFLKYLVHKSSVTTLSFPPENATMTESVTFAIALIGSYRTVDISTPLSKRPQASAYGLMWLHSRSVSSSTGTTTGVTTATTAKAGTRCIPSSCTVHCIVEKCTCSVCKLTHYTHLLSSGFDTFIIFYFLCINNTIRVYIPFTIY